MNHSVLKVHTSDNLIVALRDLSARETIHFEGETYYLPNAISAKHKFVTQDLAMGDPVTMYGVLVGKATQPIGRGEQVTTHNLKHLSEEFSTAQRKPYPAWQAPDIDRFRDRTFRGFRRSDGQVGTANYWLVVPLVFCENHNIQQLKTAFETALGYALPDTYQRQVTDLVKMYHSGQTDFDGYRPTSGKVYADPTDRLFKNIDGVKFLTHQMGCGGTNQDSERLCALFAAYANHPNVSGITVLSLGCEKSQFHILQKEIRFRNPNFDKPLLFFRQQSYGHEFEMMSDAIRETFKGLMTINRLEREDVPVSHLTIGLKCGGSDGFSGISANPVLGHLSDMLIALQGKTLLSEFPELCGVEQELIDRCISEEKAAKFEVLMRTYATQAAASGAGFDMNPSAGNIKDGLITDAIKSAGAAKKGGTAPITDVLDYADIARVPGLQLVCTPGNDVLSTTGMAAAGANILLFTTGLGTPTGNPVCPTVKISTNSTLAQRMSDIIDFDCGAIITGAKTIRETAEELLEYCIRLASGEIQTKAQLLGQDDFIPWRQGVNL